MADSFTPLFDDITAQHGVITSAVYGYIWRKCQMDRGVCDASFQTMAEDLNVSRRTIVTHVKLLVKHGLIDDLTPDADRKPHKYLVQEMQQAREIDSLDKKQTRAFNSTTREIDSTTREINAPKDTYTKRDIYIHPLPEPIQELITAIAQTVKTAYGPKTENDFEAAAYTLLGWEATPEKVCGFSKWWKENGYYKGKPALKSLTDEFRNYLQGIAVNQNGAVPKGELKDRLWYIVHRAKDYKEGKQWASPTEWQMLTAMGKWNDVRHLNEKTFSIKFYEVYKQNGNH